MSQEYLRQNTKICLNIYGGNIQAILWKMEFGDKKLAEVTKDQSDKFLDFFIDGFSRAEEDDDDDRFHIEINDLDELREYLIAFANHRIEAWLDGEFKENDKKFLGYTWGLLNKKAIRQGYANWNNVLKVDYDNAAINNALQERIDKAMDVLKGKQ